MGLVWLNGVMSVSLTWYSHGASLVKWVQRRVISEEVLAGPEIPRDGKAGDCT